MAFQVRVLPSGRTFLAEAHESLLEAALRAGIGIPYNCNSGTCGRCQARRVSGIIHEKFHDFSLTERERSNGVFLLCAAEAGSDLVIEAAEIHHAEEIPEQVIAARVAGMQDLGDVGILQVRTPRSRTLSFLAGQSVNLAIGNEVREHAIASCPCNGMVLQFHVQRQDHDSFSDRIFALQSGDAVTVTGPYGRFVLNEDSDRPILLVAEGTGLAPVKSLLEHALSLELAQPIRVVWVAEPGRHYLMGPLRALQDAMDGLRVDPVVSASPRDMARWIASDTDPSADIYIAASRALSDALKAEFSAATTISVYRSASSAGICYGSP